MWQSASAAQATHLQAIIYIPSAFAIHTSPARTALVATAEHVVGMATSSSTHLWGMAEQALVVVATLVAATVATLS